MNVSEAVSTDDDNRHDSESVITELHFVPVVQRALDNKTLFSSDYLKALGFNDSTSQVQSINHLFSVDPVTVVEVIGGIISIMRERGAAEAEKEFQGAVLGRLNEINARLIQIRQQIAELGVLILSSIENVPLEIAESNLFGQLLSVQTAFPSLRTDYRRARQLFDSLNQATAAAASFGPALVSSIGVGLTTLNVLHQYTKQPNEVRRRMFAQYAPILRAYVDASIPRSLTSQVDSAEKLSREVEENISGFAATERTYIGTHNYTRTQIYEHQKQNAGWFEYWTEEVHLQSEVPERPGRGPAERFTTMYTVDRVSDPVKPHELLYYLIGLRQAPKPHALAAGHTGGDQHFAEWQNHVIAHMLAANTSVSLARHLKQRLNGLRKSQSMAASLFEFAQVSS